MRGIAKAMKRAIGEVKDQASAQRSMQDQGGHGTGDAMRNYQVHPSAQAATDLRSEGKERRLRKSKRTYKGRVSGPGK